VAGRATWQEALATFPWKYQYILSIGITVRFAGMAKNTSISLGDHFEGFVTRQVESGRYESVSEVIRASLRLLEEREKSIGVLRHALVEGEESGDAGPLNMQEIKRKARARSANRT
jgi:antitoxin ParD1/3/4